MSDNNSRSRGADTALAPAVEKYVIPIAVALSISLISGLITYLHLFVLAPDFLVTMRTYSEPPMQHEDLTITNIGKAQAKNANIIVESPDALTSVTSRCFEGNFTRVNAGSTFRVEFDRISTNVRCQISFDSSNDQGIQGIIITADNMDGFEYYPTSQGQGTQAIAMAVTNANETPSGFKEVTFTTEGKELQIVYVTMLIIFVPSLAALLIVFYIRHRKHQRKISEAKTERRRKLTERKRELQREIKNDCQTLASYSRNIKIPPGGSPPNSIEVEVFLELQKSIDNSKTELIEIESELNAPSLREPIGKFFSEWASLETRLQDLAGKYPVDITQKPNIYEMAKALQSSHNKSRELPPDFITNLGKVKFFIESLARQPGKVKVITEKQISGYTEEIKQLSNILTNLNAKQ